MSNIFAVTHRSGWEQIFSFGSLMVVLIVAACTAFTCFIFLLLKRRRLNDKFFSGLFVLALCPWIFTSLVALINVSHFLSAEADHYIHGRIAGPVLGAMYGAAVTLISLGLYCVLYFKKRKKGVSRGDRSRD